jgi:hypothetical protein
LDGFFGLLIDPFCDSIGKIVLAAVLADIRRNILENDHRTISFQRNGRRTELWMASFTENARHACFHIQLLFYQSPLLRNS